MRKRILSLICLAALCIVSFCPLCAFGANPLDPSAEASLTLNYQKDGQVFADLQISIYRVAEAFPDGSFELVEPFASYPVNIHGITAQTEWKNVASTLNSFIVANALEPYGTGVTDGEGRVAFTGAATGLYLVSEAVAENDGGTWLFDRFMVYLPTPQEDGSFNYSVEAKPKCSSFLPKTEYRVTKLWQDADAQSERPKEVYVDIFKDGALRETQVLSAANDWSYVWRVSEGEQGKWSVAERDVAEGYTVTVQENSSSFTIVNTHKSSGDVSNDPDTGDTSNLTLYIILICIAGVLLIILGLYGRRKR